MEIKECANERWAHINSTENSVEENGGRREEEEDDDNDEALSFCDLPLIHQSRNEKNEISTPLKSNESDQQDFDFCSLSTESEMCAADEVFHQGQILPLRHSLSSKKKNFQHSNSISRSESMDDRYLISSRSSSVSSHHSSTSGSGSSSSSAAAAATDPKLPPPRNQFHSHPSPSPKLRNKINNNRNCTQKSSPWNVFRLGLVATPPEIAFRDSKTRFSGKSLDGRNSEKKRTKRWDFVGGCKCAVDAVDTVPSKVVVMKRSASDSVCEISAIHGAEEEEEESSVAKKSTKKRLSPHRRTFEWLKQLSLEGAADNEP